LLAGDVKTILNEYLRLFIEHGVVGVMLVALITYGVLRTFIIRSQYFLVGAIVSLMVFSISSYPFYTPAICLQAVVLVAYAATKCNDNPINASYFKEHYNPDHSHINVSQFKTVYKIYRRAYAVLPDEDKQIKRRRWGFCHKLDVSKEYDLNGRVELPAGESTMYATLSVFVTGDDWREFAVAENRDGKVVFEDVGLNVMYLPVLYDDLGLKHVGTPFYIDGRQRVQTMNKSAGRQDIVLYRKYPLFGNWTAQWERMVGGVLESSDSPDFRNAQTIHRISELPMGSIDVQLPKPKILRYVRYRCPPRCRTSIAEFSVYQVNGSEVVEAIPIGHLVKENQLKYAFDGNELTFPDTKKEAYWIGLDLMMMSSNRATDIGRITLLPKSDGNFIVKGNEYELFYFDRQWISLGKQTAALDSLVYNKVPKGVVFLLKNWTKGSEERIFTMEGEKQVWW